MFVRPFTDHPKAVGESYGEHLASASGFAGELILAGLACGVHSVLPFLFEQTASRAVFRLHARMLAKRDRLHAHETVGPQPHSKAVFTQA